MAIWKEDDEEEEEEEDDEKKNPFTVTLHLSAPHVMLAQKCYHS